MAALLAMVAFQIAGLWGDLNAFTLGQCLYLLVCFLILAKEAIFITTLLVQIAHPAQMDLLQASSFDRALVDWIQPPPLEALTLPAALQDLLSDLCLLIFSMLPYTALWELVAGRSPIQGDWPGVLVEYLGATIYFSLIWFLSTQWISYRGWS